MKKEKSVLHLCEITLLALVSLLIMDFYLLKFLQSPETSYHPMLRLMEATLALLVAALALTLIQRASLTSYHKCIPGYHRRSQQNISGKVYSGAEQPPKHIRCWRNDV